MQTLRSEINSYKTAREYEPEVEIGRYHVAGDMTSELRGLGISTVDRPQIQLNWEDLVLAPGMAFTSMPTILSGSSMAKFYEMVFVTEGAAYVPQPYPSELFTL
ncbi:M24 family metallopeptidase [Agrobacterium radiobacter]